MMFSACALIPSRHMAAEEGDDGDVVVDEKTSEIELRAIV